MLINTALEWPNEWYKFVSSDFNLRTFALGSQAVFSPRRNMRRVYQVWFAQYVIKPEIGVNKWQGKSAFFSRLDGESGLLRIGDPLRCIPQYNRKKFPNQPWSDGTLFSDGTGWADGALPATAALRDPAEMGAAHIVIKNLLPSIPGALNNGDLLELAIDGQPGDISSLHEVVVGGATNADGEIGVEIRPRLRRDFAANDMVILHHPKGVFQLTDSEQGAFSRSANQGSAGFQVVEYVG